MSGKYPDTIIHNITIIDMAHECPECYSRCHCNGDIDDIELPIRNGQYCTHCYEDWDDEEDDFPLQDYEL